jgi:aspartate/methionine/tyrosine aminotransferase
MDAFRLELSFYRHLEFRHTEGQSAKKEKLRKRFTMNFLKQLALLTCDHMMLSSSTPLPRAKISATSLLINTLGQLKQIARDAGFEDGQMIMGNIGDVGGIPELGTVKRAREVVSRRMNESVAKNLNGYPPYPGLPALRQRVATDLLGRLGFGTPTAASLERADILKSGQSLGDLVSIASGSVGCSGSIYAHVKLAQLAGAEKPKIAIDRTHYWKHQGVGEDLGRVVVYDFMKVSDRGTLRLDASEVDRFGASDGGVMVLNFGNPAAFLPSKEDATDFVLSIKNWNAKNPEKQITVIVDGPYDDFDGTEGYRFPSLLFKAGVVTSYSHARTKEEFATGSRLGEVISNHPVIRDIFDGYKADYVGSDSRIEQEMGLEVLASMAERNEEKEVRMAMVRERKSFFWAQLGEMGLDQIKKDTAPFYRPGGAFYVFMNLQSMVGAKKHVDSLAVCESMAQKGVILVPGTLFDVNHGDASGINRTGVRVSFAAFGESNWRDQIRGLVGALADTFYASQGGLGASDLPSRL